MEIKTKKVPRRWGIVGNSYYQGGNRENCGIKQRRVEEKIQKEQWGKGEERAQERRIIPKRYFERETRVI